MVDAFKFLCVHGFGGYDENPQLSRQTSTAVARLKLPCEVTTFAWDSRKPTLDRIGYEFGLAVEETVRAAASFDERIRECELAGVPYFIAGHSLGARVIVEFLNRTTQQSTLCRGIFLLGAAVDTSCQISPAFLPRGANVINYFSPKDDDVLASAYFNKQGSRAAGSARFEDGSGPIRNYRCSATHAYKPGLVHSDWSRLAPALVEFAAYSEGISLGGRRLPTWRSRLGRGDDWWNNILELDRYEWHRDKVAVQVQQHKFEGHYRLSVSGYGTERRYREGWAYRLEPLLKHIGLTRDHACWPLREYRNVDG